MLYREIIAVCSETHTKHINTLCGAERGTAECQAAAVYTYVRTCCLSPSEYSSFSSLQTEAAGIPEALLRGVLSACKPRVSETRSCQFRIVVQTFESPPRRTVG